VRVIFCRRSRSFSGPGWSGGWNLAAARIPELVFGTAGLPTAEGGDGAGAADGPVHAGLLEPLADDGLAAGPGDAGADEQAALAEPVAAHAGGVVLEVAQGGVQLVFLHAFQGKDAGGGGDAVDVAVAEVRQAGGEPFFFPGRRP
jgi:hypothetical protein